MDHIEEGNYAWELMQKGNSESAAAIFERLVQDNPNVGDWNNYGTSLLLVGKLREAEGVFRHVRTLPDAYGYVSLTVGSALWIQDQHLEACNDWREELDRIMTTKLKRYDASGVFICPLLWWASLRLKSPAIWIALLPQLKLVLKTRGQQEVWGLTIMQFILGHITPSEFLETAPGVYGDGRRDPADRGVLRRMSQAHFYIAGKHEVGSTEWTHNLGMTVKLGTPSALDMPERNIARYEMERK